MNEKNIERLIWIRHLSLAFIIIVVASSVLSLITNKTFFRDIAVWTALLGLIIVTILTARIVHLEKRHDF